MIPSPNPQPWPGRCAEYIDATWLNTLKFTVHRKMDWTVTPDSGSGVKACTGTDETTITDQTFYRIASTEDFDGSGTQFKALTTCCCNGAQLIFDLSFTAPQYWPYTDKATNSLGQHCNVSYCVFLCLAFATFGSCGLFSPTKLTEDNLNIFNGGTDCGLDPDDCGPYNTCSFFVAPGGAAGGTQTTTIVTDTLPSPTFSATESATGSGIFNSTTVGSGVSLPGCGGYSFTLDYLWEVSYVWA